MARSFVVKHIRNKHAHVVEAERERLQEEAYWENFRCGAALRSTARVAGGKGAALASHHPLRLRPLASLPLICSQRLWAGGRRGPLAALLPTLCLSPPFPMPASTLAPPLVQGLPEGGATAAGGGAGAGDGGHGGGRVSAAGHAVGGLEGRGGAGLGCRRPAGAWQGRWAWQMRRIGLEQVLLHAAAAARPRA